VISESELSTRILQLFLSFHCWYLLLNIYKKYFLFFRPAYKISSNLACLMSSWLILSVFRRTYPIPTLSNWNIPFSYICKLHEYIFYPYTARRIKLPLSLTCKLRTCPATTPTRRSTCPAPKPARRSTCPPPLLVSSLHVLLLHLLACLSSLTCKLPTCLAPTLSEGLHCLSPLLVS
jgi:hypothetical protein